jgi:hypothetical protein
MKTITVILFKGTVKQIPEFSAYIKTYPKNTTISEYVKQEIKKK